MVGAITEGKECNVDVSIPNIEIVQFTTANTGDYYDCKKLKHVDGAFASQKTADGEEIQCSWALQSNGVPRVTLTLDTQTNVVGYLTIFGRH